jgi:Flp pilus assembly protein TadG
VRWIRARQRRDEGGAALAEFALVAPVLFSVLLGILTGGMAYNRQLDLSHAVREGARYAATLDSTATFNTSTCDSTGTWEGAVTSTVVARSSGSLTCAQVTCVALVTGSPGSETVVSNHSTSSSGNTTKCYSDATGSSSAKRVQITVDRGAGTDKLQFIFGSYSLRLKKSATARYEG